ncbi:hypothetical protein EO95_14005 [Methanosarcina sp. 1.H.T.1A.1]|nr:hypothetical protein EO95_14005 [Methanosarcina sp. 1.H.T.1A.1]
MGIRVFTINQKLRSKVQLAIQLEGAGNFQKMFLQISGLFTSLLSRFTQSIIPFRFSIILQ